MSQFILSVASVIHLSGHKEKICQTLGGNYFESVGTIPTHIYYDSRRYDEDAVDDHDVVIIVTA